MPKAVVLKGSVPDKDGKRVIINRVGDFTAAQIKAGVKSGKLRPIDEKGKADSGAKNNKAEDGQSPAADEPRSKPAL